MAKLKVSELPIKEQQALIQEAKELEIGGLLTNYGVDTLKEKIAKVKEKQKGKQDDDQKDDEGNQDGNKEPQEGDDADKTQKDDEDNQDGNKEPQEDNKKDEKQKPVSETKAKEEAKKDVKYKICHICRSKVINGVCTGCGYTLNP